MRAADRVTSIRRSGIREVMDLADGRGDVLRLEVGEPDHATPEHIVRAAMDAAAAGYTHYTANRGLPEVRRAMAAKLRADNGIDAAPEDIVITTGAVTALMEALTVLLDPGEAVLLPDPGWPNYQMMAAVLGARVVHYPLAGADGFVPDPERLDRLATANPDARVIVVNSPNNPTGAVYPREVVEGVLQVARNHDLFVLSDECYEQILFAGEHVSPGSLDPDGRVLSVLSMSKSYAMTGWRIGYLHAAPHLAELVARVQEPVISCATALAQKAAQAALEGDQSCVRAMADSYRWRRDAVVEILDAGGLLVNVPDGAFYILADVSRAALDTYAFARRLLAEHAVAVAPGEAFGPSGRGLVRLSLATAPDDLTEGAARLVRAVAEWAGG